MFKCVRDPTQGWKMYARSKAEHFLYSAVLWFFKGAQYSGRMTIHNIKQHVGLELAGAGSAGRGRDHKGRTCASRMGGGSSE
jgi:hypothetical protein